MLPELITLIYGNLSSIKVSDVRTFRSSSIRDFSAVIIYVMDAKFQISDGLVFGRSGIGRIFFGALKSIGISAESGVPTFRGSGGLWRTWSAMELATPEAFAENPSLVWEFYHYRRCVVSDAVPNAGHVSLAMLEKKCDKEGKQFTLLTQNIDGLHVKAGSKNVVELHGSLWKTRCCRCDNVEQNHDKVICPALEGKGAPDPHVKDARIPVADLPHCKKCNGLLRPHVVWFGESLDHQIFNEAENALINCDLFLVIGTSGLVKPAANFVPSVHDGGGVIAEFNLEDTPSSRYCRFKFHGSSAKTLPIAFNIPAEKH